MNRPVIVVGAGGHASVVVDALLASGRQIIGLTDVDPQRAGILDLQIIVLGDDAKILEYSTEDVELVLGIGSVRAVVKRREVYERFRGLGYQFTSVTHPSAIVSPSAVLGNGVQAMAGTIVNPGCRIGENVLINTGASIDHDCVIEHHVHIAPGVVLSGEVWVGALTHIGTAATVTQGVRIGRSVTVGAGAVVIKDLPDGAMAVGVPARVVER